MQALFLLFLDVLLGIATIWCGLLLIGSSIAQQPGDMGGLALIAFGTKILATIIFGQLNK